MGRPKGLLETLAVEEYCLQWALGHADGCFSEFTSCETFSQESAPNALID